MYTIGDIVTYLGRAYSVANVIGGSLVLRDDQNDTEGGYFTVPAVIVKKA
jgi:hypothetical protein